MSADWDDFLRITRARAYRTLEHEPSFKAMADAKFPFEPPAHVYNQRLFDENMDVYSDELVAGTRLGTHNGYVLTPRLEPLSWSVDVEPMAQIHTDRWDLQNVFMMETISKLVLHQVGAPEWVLKVQADFGEVIFAWLVYKKQVTRESAQPIG